MATTSTLLQQQTSAYKYGILEKKSPSVLARWQARHVILAVDMFLYYAPPKTEGQDCGVMKGFVILKDVLDVNEEGDRKLTVSVKGRMFLWRAPTPEMRDNWCKALRVACAIINCSEPQITLKLNIDKLWQNELLGISLKDRRVVSINWDGARLHGWKLGDLCTQVGDKVVNTPGEAVDALRDVRKTFLAEGTPFEVNIMRYNPTSEQEANTGSAAFQPSVHVTNQAPIEAEENEAASQDDHKEEKEDADHEETIDPEEGHDKM